MAFLLTDLQYCAIIATNKNQNLARMRKIGNVGDAALGVPRNALHVQRDAEGGVPYTYKF